MVDLVIDQMELHPNVLIKHMKQEKQIFENNFDFLRIFFASLVLITHSYPIAGDAGGDSLFQFSHGETSFSEVGVQGFFVISGHLITISLFRSTNLLNYFFKRIIRVFPALWVVVLLAVVGGFFLSGSTFLAYSSNHSVHKYFLTVFLRIQPYIDGVFSTNPIKYVNGSLWTVPYEFLWYILISGLFFIRSNVRACLTILVLAFLAILASRLFFKTFDNDEFLGLAVGNIASLGLFFVAGALLSLVPLPAANIRNMLVICLLVVMGVIMHFSRLYYLGHLFVLPPLVIAFGTLRSPLISWIHKFGDISYGIYIWGFPVQQTLTHFFHFDQTRLLWISVLCTFVLGYISWHLIEKRALRLKHRL